ncbi:hypothetical protein KP509_17G063800 [Ceratopteris richardii]|uniref:Uncharacterized protein n=3 Tax=Ceratopteris richardii TaxID=49495 RepID=A0A8T2T046_CERRI|nr:hypothetical protein KP509_17G063800 [Ceratopteris richardii]
MATYYTGSYVGVNVYTLTGRDGWRMEYVEEKEKTSSLQKEYASLSDKRKELTGVQEGLNGRLRELEHEKSTTEEDKKKLLSSLLEKENEIKGLKVKLTLLDEKEEELGLLKKELVLKDDEIRNLKAQIKKEGKISREGHPIQSSNKNDTAVDNDEMKDMQIEMLNRNTTLSENAIMERKNQTETSDEDADKGTPELGEDTKKEAPVLDEDTESGIRELDEEIETEADEERDTESEVGKSKKHSEKEENSQLLETKDEESKDDYKEETETEDEADVDKALNDEDGDKLFEQETDDQSDLDLESINKTDLEETENATME